MIWTIQHLSSGQPNRLYSQIFRIYVISAKRWYKVIIAAPHRSRRCEVKHFLPLNWSMLVSFGTNVLTVHSWSGCLHLKYNLSRDVDAAQGILEPTSMDRIENSEARRYIAHLPAFIMRMLSSDNWGRTYFWSWATLLNATKLPSFRNRQKTIKRSLLDQLVIYRCNRSLTQ